MGLTRAIMSVLNLRDEPERKDAPRGVRQPEAVGTALYEEVNEELSKLASAAPFVRHLYLADSAGRLLGMAHASRAVDDLAVDLRPAMQGITGAKWNGELKRVFLDGDNGIAALLRVAQDRWLIALCERGTSLGTVSVGVGKFLARTTPRTNGHAASQSEA
jgi:hypothetical protein